MFSTSIARRLSLAVLGLGSLAATVAAGPPIKPAPTPPQKGVGINIANIDPSVKPCEDFFHFASGNWLKNNPIPAAESRWGSFNELADHNNATLRGILNEAARNSAKAPKGSNAQKVGDFYASAMDSAAIDAAGLTYLQPHLNRIAAIKDLGEMQRFLADPQAQAGSVWFGTGVGQDEKISSQYAVQMGQGGLSLPDRDYYLKDDVRSKAIRTAYDTYLVNTFKMLGDAEATAKANAATVTRIETRLAKASKSRVDLRDPYANYHKMTLAAADAAYPNLALPLALKGNGLGAAREVIVGQPDFLKEVNTMFKEEPIADQKQYLRFHLVSSVTPALPKAFGDEAFRFAQTLSGAKKQQPRWKRMLGSTDRALGEAFGQLYVDKAFSPAAKTRAKQMIENLRVAYAERIKATDWMSAGTKAEALKKLNAFTVKIGYPDKWKDYSALSISRASYLNNLLAAREWASKDEIKHFGKPIDRGEWGMTPPTVNAYYNSSMNEIVFPAGILQPPFYDPKADDAVNYGGIGAVIGHEMTHGFDDQGRKSDASGNLRDWWTKADHKNFAKKTKQLVAQYNSFSPVKGHFVNGELTLGENIADNSGVAIAYKAYKLSLNGKQAPVIDGFTGEQRFYAGFAQVWRMKMREAQQLVLLKTDPHSPGQFRANGTMRNQPGFYQAFDVKPGDKMYLPPKDRVIMW